MTPEEKEKLYTAIGYSGSSHNLTLPKHVSTPAAVVFILSTEWRLVASWLFFYPFVTTINTNCTCWDHFCSDSTKRSSLKRMFDLPILHQLDFRCCKVLLKSVCVCVFSTLRWSSPSSCSGPRWQLENCRTSQRPSKSKWLTSAPKYLRDLELRPSGDPCSTLLLNVTGLIPV